MKQMFSLGKAKLATDSTSNQQLSDAYLSDISEFREFTATALSATCDATEFNVDSGSSSILVPTGQNLNNKKSSSLVLRTVDNCWMTAQSKGKINLQHLGLSEMTARKVQGLAEPLLLAADMTDFGCGVTFLKNSIIFIDQPKVVGKYLRHSGDVVS